MSNDMKLIMESWRSYNQEQSLINENVAAQAWDEVAKELDAVFQKAAEEKKDKPKELQQEEVASLLTLGWVLKFIFTKLLGAIVISAVISKVATSFVEYYRKYKQSQRAYDPEDVIDPEEHKAMFLRAFTSFLEESAKTIATGGAYQLGTKVVDKWITNREKKEKLKKAISAISSLMVFIITLGAAGSELLEGIEEAGTIKGYILDLAKSAGGGLESLPTLTAIGDIFELSADVTEGTFKTGAFFKRLVSELIRAWPDILNWIQQRL